MTDRRYNDAEAAAIFLRAAEGAHAEPVEPASPEGLSLAQLQEIALEAGIPADAVALAAQSIDHHGLATPAQTFLGFPIGVERNVALPRPLTESEWEHLVVHLRDEFRAKGSMSSTGSFRQWSNGNLQILLEPTHSGQRLRMRTVKGNARASLVLGPVGVLLAALVAGSAALNGQLATAIPSALMLSLGGGILFASQALRLPGWARLRLQQMDRIGARLVESTRTAAELRPGDPPA